MGKVRNQQNSFYLILRYKNRLEVEELESGWTLENFILSNLTVYESQHLTPRKWVNHNESF